MTILKKAPLLLLLIAALSLPCALNAATIEFSALSTQILSTTGSPLPDGDIVELGTFTGGTNAGFFTTNTTYSALNSLFVPLTGGTTSISTIFSIPGSFDSTIGYAGSANILLYMWVFNVNSNPSTAGAWAIITDSLWKTPDGTNPTANVQFDAGDPGVNVPTGAAGLVTGTGVKLGVVPEPTSIALLGSGLLLAGALSRRRRK